MSSQNQYAMMEWPTDGNKLSIHHLKHVINPKKTWNDYDVGYCGVAKYPGMSGQWDFKILAVGPIRQTLTETLEVLLKEKDNLDKENSSKGKKKIHTLPPLDDIANTVAAKNVQHNAALAAAQAILRLRNQPTTPSNNHVSLSSESESSCQTSQKNDLASMSNSPSNTPSQTYSLQHVQQPESTSTCNNHVSLSSESEPSCQTSQKNDLALMSNTPIQTNSLQHLQQPESASTCNNHVSLSSESGSSCQTSQKNDLVSMSNSPSNTPSQTYSLQFTALATAWICLNL